MLFLISVLLILISFYLFFNKNTKEKDYLFAPFCFLIGFTTGLAKKEFQIYWALITIIPLIIFILVRTHDYLKNRQL